MRILQISSARSIGGGERHVIGLSNELAKRGDEIFVAVVPGSPIPGRLGNVPRTGIAEFPLRNAVDISSALGISKLARAQGVELINAHLARDYPIAAAAALIAKVPYVLTRHVLFPMSRLHRALLRDAKYVIAPSNAVAESLRAQGLFSEDKIVTIRYGLDIDNFPERVPSDRRGICIGSIGNLDPVKGFDILIRAAEIIKRSGPAVKFKIVGEDRSRDRRNESALRKLIAGLQLDGEVELAGWSDNIGAVLGDFDIFVSASRSESFGFVVAEAMLSGLPVIATETAGAREIISDPSLGRLLPIDSPEALAEAILELLDDPQERSRLTQNGREHVRKNFSLRRMVDETEKLYSRAV